MPEVAKPARDFEDWLVTEAKWSTADYTNPIAASRDRECLHRVWLRECG